MPSTLPKIVSKPANWHSDRHGVTPKFIVAHGTAGIDSVAYLQRGGEKKDGSDRKVSIHVLIAKDGTIYRMVPDERVANHAGYGRVVINGKTYQSDGVNCNVASLGFELENLQNGKDPYSRNQLLSMGLVLGAKNIHTCPSYATAISIPAVAKIRSVSRSWRSNSGLLKRLSSSLPQSPHAKQRTCSNNAGRYGGRNIRSTVQRAGLARQSCGMPMPTSLVRRPPRSRMMI
jgi:hypothetical protein